MSERKEPYRTGNVVKAAVIQASLFDRAVKAEAEVARLKQEKQQLADKIKSKMDVIYKDQRYNTGDHRWYQTGRYDAFDFVLEQLRKTEE